jgi:hypothetical protein
MKGSRSAMMLTMLHTRAIQRRTFIQRSMLGLLPDKVRIAPIYLLPLSATLTGA